MCYIFIEYKALQNLNYINLKKEYFNCKIIDIFANNQLSIAIQK